MNYPDLPIELRNYWNSLKRKEQREVLTLLGDNIKPEKAFLKAKAETSVVAPILYYINQNKIPFKVERKGKHVVFAFESIKVRNQVFMGRLTI